MIRKYREPNEVNRTEHNEIEILKTNWKQYYKSTFTMPWWVIILTMVLRLIACCLCSTTKHSIVSPLMVENFQRIVLIRREGSLSCQTRWGTRPWINSLSPLTTFYFSKCQCLVGRLKTSSLRLTVVCTPQSWTLNWFRTGLQETGPVAFVCRQSYVYLVCPILLYTLPWSRLEDRPNLVDFTTSKGHWGPNPNRITRGTDAETVSFRAMYCCIILSKLYLSTCLFTAYGY